MHAFYAYSLTSRAETYLCREGDKAITGAPDHGFTTGSGQNRHQGLVGEPIFGVSAGDTAGSSGLSPVFTGTFASCGMAVTGAGEACSPDELDLDTPSASVAGVEPDFFATGSG